MHDKITRVNITSATDPSYPFGKDIFETKDVFYHGTSNIYRDRIEAKGFTVNKLRCDVEDIQQILRVYESIGYHGSDGGGYPILKPFFIQAWSSTGYKYVPISFTSSYWSARRYSRNRGGETVVHIIKAAQQFERLVNTPEIASDHKKYLQSMLHHPVCQPGLYSERPKYLEYLTKLEDEIQLSNGLDQLLEIRGRYEQQTRDAYPVVYAIQLSPAWIEQIGQFGWRDIPNEEKYEDFDFGFELRSVECIPPSSILARADFPNGVDNLYHNLDIDSLVSWTSPHNHHTL